MAKGNEIVVGVGRCLARTPGMKVKILLNVYEMLMRV
jgi:hypothetical protein